MKLLPRYWNDLIIALLVSTVSLAIYQATLTPKAQTARASTRPT